jgi:hypothetical protein
MNYFPYNSHSALDTKIGSTANAWRAVVAPS